MNNACKVKLRLKIFSFSFLATFLVFFFLGIASSFDDASVNRVLRVSVNGGEGYGSIQEAINNASSGDTILVGPGVYYENIVVNKSVLIVGENRLNTIVDGGNKWMAVVVAVSGAVLRNLTIRHGIVGVVLNKHIDGVQVVDNDIVFNSYDGVYGDRSGSNVIANNNISFNGWRGVFLYACAPSVVENNFVSYNLIDGIVVRYSNNTVVQGNEVYGNSYNGIVLRSDEDPKRPSGLSKNNVVRLNRVLNNTCGIKVWHLGEDTSFARNEIYGNYIAYNTVGLNLSGSWGNFFYHNNFVANFEQLWVSNSYGNSWDGGYPFGGNYWSNYDGVDADANGIGDVPYTIDANNVDRYPLIAPITVFDAGTWNGESYNVNIVSNSTVSDFYFKPEEGPFVKFTVSGMDGTKGFSRVAIPRKLLWAENGWKVMVDNNSVDPIITEDEDYTFFYFTYEQSIKTIEIIGTHVIPEFPLFSFLLLFVLSLSIAVALAKNVHRK